jgi:hypothetical protein
MRAVEYLAIRSIKSYLSDLEKALVTLSRSRVSLIESVARDEEALARPWSASHEDRDGGFGGNGLRQDYHPNVVGSYLRDRAIHVKSGIVPGALHGVTRTAHDYGVVRGIAVVVHAVSGGENEVFADKGAAAHRLRRKDEGYTCSRRLWSIDAAEDFSGYLFGSCFIGRGKVEEERYEESQSEGRGAHEVRIDALGGNVKQVCQWLIHVFEFHSILTA